MIKRFRNKRVFESAEQQDEITAYDVAKFLKRKGLATSTAPYPKGTGVDDGDCFIALKDNGDFIVFHDMKYNDGEFGVMVMTAAWDLLKSTKVDISTKEELDKEISKIL